MSNDNCYYNNENCRNGNRPYGGEPTPPPFPGDRRNRGHEREPYRNYDMPYGHRPCYGGQPPHYGGQPPRQQWQQSQTSFQQPVAATNPFGTAGFVLSIVTMLVGWLPYLGWLIWVLAIVFSAIGMSKKPRGLATAGLIISVGIPVLLLMAVILLGISIAAFGETAIAEALLM